MNVKIFRQISIWEGISFLIILFVTVPLKYIFEIGLPNQIVGMTHGILFLAYLYGAYEVKDKLNWDWKTFGIVALCSVVPFGTFWMERKYLINNS